MSGYEGHEGYMVLLDEEEDEAPENGYYVTNFFQERVTITVDLQSGYIQPQ